MAQSKPPSPTPAPQREELSKGLYLDVSKGKVMLSGPGLDARIIEDLRAWIAQRTPSEPS